VRFEELQAVIRAAQEAERGSVADFCIIHKSTEAEIQWQLLLRVYICLIMSSSGQLHRPSQAVHCGACAELGDLYNPELLSRLKLVPQNSINVLTWSNIMTG
jgi:hypothetical protein